MSLSAFVSVITVFQHPVNIFDSVSRRPISSSQRVKRVEWTCSKVRSSKRKRGNQQQLTIAKEKEEEVVSKLKSLQEKYGENMYMFEERDKFDEVWTLIDELEGNVGDDGIPASSIEKKLLGGWRLVLTDDPVLLKNRGVTGLGKSLGWLGLKFGGIGIWLGEDGLGKTIEILNWIGGGRGVSWLEGKWEFDKGRLLLRYEEAKLLWVGGLKGGRGAEMLVTWVGDKLRVGRGRNGSVFVFERDDEGWSFGEKR